MNNGLKCLLITQKKTYITVFKTTWNVPKKTQTNKKNKTKTKTQLSIRWPQLTAGLNLFHQFHFFLQKSAQRISFHLTSYSKIVKSSLIIFLYLFGNSCISRKHSWEKHGPIVNPNQGALWMVGYKVWTGVNLTQFLPPRHGLFLLTKEDPASVRGEVSCTS